MEDDPETGAVIVSRLPKATTPSTPVRETEPFAKSTSTTTTTATAISADKTPEITSKSSNTSPGKRASVSFANVISASHSESSPATTPAPIEVKA